MVLEPSNSSNLEQLALKGLKCLYEMRSLPWVIADQQSSHVSYQHLCMYVLCPQDEKLLM